jgi:Flp pilus assembly protein TadD
MNQSQSIYRLLITLPCAVMLLLVACESQPDTARTEAEYRTVVAEPRRNTDAARQAHREGYQHLQAGDLQQAEAAFKQALTADIEYGPAHLNLGAVYLQRGQYHLAAIESDAAAKLMPGHPGPPNNIGLAYFRDGKAHESVEYFRKAVELAPENVEYRANLVRSLVARGDRTQEVVTLLQQVVAEDRRPAWIDWAQDQLAGMAELGG